MKRIQNNDKLSVFTFQIYKNKDKIHNFDKNRKKALHEVFCIQCCETIFFREYLALFNNIL